MDAGLYGSLQRGGLAFAGERLFAVAGSTTGGEKLVLHVVTPRRPSAVELRIDRTRTVAGRHVRLDLTLTPAAAERTVSVYRTVAGRPRELVTRVEVATSGRTPFRIEADRNARYVAEFGGDDVYERASDGVRLDVAPRLATKMLGYRAKRGGAYVYSPSHDAVIQAKVTPGHAGDCVVFRAQFRVAGAWGYDATTKCVKLNAASKARGALAGDRRLVGIPIRMRVEWRGDEENIKNRSAWRQVRFG
jgi:hypothetical protein